MRGVRGGVNGSRYASAWFNFCRHRMLHLPRFLIASYAAALLIWLVTVALTIVALRFSTKGDALRVKRAVIFAAVAVAISFFATVTFPMQFDYWVTENGRVTGWHFESRWFFAPTGVLALIAFISSVRARSKATAAPCPQAPRPKPFG
jgi:hypothetical protein